MFDVFLESRVDDHWNVDGDGGLSALWTSHTQFKIVE